MLRNSIPSSSTGGVAVATGIVLILAIVLILLFFTLGEPFGTLNDLANGLAGILCGLLAWMLFAQHPAKSSLLSELALALAVIGAGVVVVGTVLVVFKVTGWVLAAWYTAVGNALIGIWLAAFSYSAGRSLILPGSLPAFGLITGLLMVTGFFAVPGILARIDSMASLPWYLNLSYVEYLGTYILFPAWAIWLGRTLLVK